VSAHSVPALLSADSQLVLFAPKYRLAAISYDERLTQLFFLDGVIRTLPTGGFHHTNTVEAFELLHGAKGKSASVPWKALPPSAQQA
jgi:hypothetical protein